MVGGTLLESGDKAGANKPSTNPFDSRPAMLRPSNFRVPYSWMPHKPTMAVMSPATITRKESTPKTIPATCGIGLRLADRALASRHMTSMINGAITLKVAH